MEAWLEWIRIFTFDHDSEGRYTLLDERGVIARFVEPGSSQRVQYGRIRISPNQDASVITARIVIFADRSASPDERPEKNSAGALILLQGESPLQVIRTCRQHYPEWFALRWIARLSGISTVIPGNMDPMPGIRMISNASPLPESGSECLRRASIKEQNDEEEE